MKKYFIESRKNGVIEKVVFDKKTNMCVFENAGELKYQFTENFKKDPDAEYRTVEEITIIRKSPWGGRMVLSRQTTIETDQGSMELPYDIEIYINQLRNENKILQKEIDNYSLSELKRVCESKKTFSISKPLISLFGVKKIDEITCPNCQRKVKKDDLKCDECHDKLTFK